MKYLLDKFKEFVLDWGSFAQKIIEYVDNDMVSISNNYRQFLFQYT